MNVPDEYAAKPQQTMCDFTKAEPWRVFRIMAELVDSFETMSKYQNLISIFGSARIKPEDPYYQDCVRLGELLASANYGILSGGGPGIMEAANRGAWKRKGVSIGLNIKLPMEQHSNLYQTESMDFRYFFIRKICFLKYSVAAVAYPGGFGTLDEFAETLTLIQTKKVNRIPLVVVGPEFWQPLLDWFKQTLELEGLIGENDLSLIHVAKNADDAYEYICKWHQENGIFTTVRDDE